MGEAAGRRRRWDGLKAGQGDEAEAEAGSWSGVGTWRAVMGWPKVRPKSSNG